MDLITLEEYKAYNALSDNPKEDGKIALLISSISNLIQTYLGLNFEGGQDITEVISLDYDTNVIYLENYPVVGPVTVSETDRVTWGSSIHVPLTYALDYILNAAQGTLTRVYTPGGFANWPISPAAVTINYTTAGYFDALDDTPADLKLAAIELVKYYMKEEYRQSKSVQGTSIVNTLAAGEDFPQHIQVILDRYSQAYKK